MLKAVGYSDTDLHKPLIGIANTWIEIGPCNYHLRDLAGHVRQGIREAGGTAMEFNTVSISDGITMGTAGMRMSLVSREVIADSIEMVVDGNQSVVSEEARRDVVLRVLRGHGTDVRGHAIQDRRTYGDRTQFHGLRHDAYPTRQRRDPQGAASLPTGAGTGTASGGVVFVIWPGARRARPT